MPPKAKTPKKPKPLKKASLPKRFAAFLHRVHKEEPPEHFFSKNAFKRVIRLAELAGRLKERQRSYPPDRRKDLEGLIELISDFDYQLKCCSGDETSLLRHYRSKVEGLKPKDYWVFFRSPPGTWKRLIGRAGWYVIDYENAKIKAFIVTSKS
jgi:hypothetical protein